jgi:hypothetical protein
MSRFSHICLGLCLLTLVLACVPQLHPISARNPDLFSKETDHLMGGSRGTGEVAPPELFVKQKRIAVAEADRPNETGSLFNPDNERNYLFTPTGPLNVGRFVKIQVVANRQGERKKDGTAKGKDKDKDKEKDKAGKGAKAGAGKGDGDGKGDGKGGDELEAELLKALPDLEPAEKGEIPLLKDFKMQIVHRYENGDVLAMLDRKSQYEDHTNEVTVQARIPYDRLASGDDLTTEDLLDVHMLQSHAGELADRHSSGWEDEYSLRLSGFSEAKSKVAMELEDQRKKLKEADEKAETKIKAFGEERRQFAKQRDELNQKKAAQDAKVLSLEDKVQEQKGTIDNQTEQLKSQEAEKAAAEADSAAPSKGKAAPKAVTRG